MPDEVAFACLGCGAAWPDLSILRRVLGAPLTAMSLFSPLTLAAATSAGSVHTFSVESSATVANCGLVGCMVSAVMNRACATTSTR